MRGRSRQARRARCQVCELLASDEPRFKPNVGVVLVDFLVRNGFVSPDDPSYLQLLGALRGAECS